MSVGGKSIIKSRHNVQNFLAFITPTPTMAGIKRRVDVADDRGGKRAKVKKDMSKPKEEKKKDVKAKKQKKVESSDEEEDDEGVPLDEGEQSGFLSDDEDSAGGMDVDGAEEGSKSNGAAVKNGERSQASYGKGKTGC